MPRSQKPQLTRLEWKLMQALWKLGAASVAEVQKQLQPALAYTTVQTMLNILERKGHLRRQMEGRAYLYSATITEQRALGTVVRDLVDRVFGGSGEELVMSLVKNRQIDAQALARLSAQLDGAEPQETEKPSSGRKRGRP